MAELINGLGGEQGFGENSLSRNDDGSTEAIDITSVFDGSLNFFGNQFDQLWVNNNGNITFNGSLSSYTPEGITSETNNPLITPYWADVETSPSGELAPTSGGNSTGSNLVYYDLDEANNTFTATWDDVGYFSNNTDKLNAFQLQLIGQGNGDFDIVFRYEDINWTTGDLSGGSDGLGGDVARGGFSSGDGENFFELPQSGNEQAMLNLEETTGNTGQTGLFRFEVRNGESDVSPVLTTSNISVEEGNSDDVTEATFAVELLQAIEEEVTVDYATTDGTATAGEDYEATSGTLTFAPGETSKTITVSVNGDEDIEPNEDVVLELSNLTNAEFPFDAETFSKILTIQDDEIIPNPPTRGNNWGDPHLVTFDGASYDFQAVGEFILTQSNSSDFAVQVRQEPLGDRDDVSINTAAATQLGEETVGLYTNREQPLVIGDTETELANGESLEVGNGEIFRTNDNRYTVVNAGEDGEVNAGDSQLVATVYDNHLDVEVYIAEVNRGGTTGLLGNFNDDSSDDLAVRNGETLEQPIPFEQLYGEYADSWRISQEESLFSYLDGNSTETFTNTDFPSRAITVDDLSEEERTAAEQVVDEAGITDPNLREAAILDVALSGDDSFAIGASQSQIAQAEVEVEEAPEIDIPASPEGKTGESWGDPHIVTFDGVAYDFQAAGEFILTQETEGDLQVQVRQEPVRSNVSVNTAVATTLDGETVMIDVSDDQPLQINGNANALADGDSTAVANGEIFRSGNTYTIIYPGEDGEVNDGDERLIVDTRSSSLDVEIQLAEDRAGGFGGLLGNANMDGSDDIAAADGEPLPRPLPFDQLYGDFRSDWRVDSEEESLFTYDEGESPDSFYQPDFPSEPATLDNLDPEVREAAEQVARDAGLEEGTFNFESAVLDFALTDDPEFLDAAINATTVEAENTVPPEEEDSNLQSDLNEDGIVNLDDLGIFASAFGSSEGSGNFNATVDFNGDGLIDLDDLPTLSSEFGS